MLFFYSDYKTYFFYFNQCVLSKSTLFISLQKCEHLSNQIEALEGQLSQRSRIVTSRRPPTRSGPRKVEEMQKNLSGLRQQYEQEMEKVERTGKELMEIQCSAQEVCVCLPQIPGDCGIGINQHLSVCKGDVNVRIC